MAFTPTVESANRAINRSRQLYQAALDAVAEGQQQLQNEVDAGRLTPGTPEFLAAKNKLVNSAQSYAESAKMVYDEDLAALDRAREANLDSQIANRTFFQPTGATTAAPANTDAVPVRGQTDPEAEQANTTANADEKIVPADEITPNAFQEAGNTDGYGSQNEISVPTADVRTAPAIIGDEDAQQRPFQTFAAVGDEDAQQLPFTPQNAVAVGQINTQKQETNRNLAQFPRNTDWRVTLRLAPNANYLYNSAQPGLLAPLKTTNGVIFPYTPSITTAYKANYSSYDLTHSNYRGYFYQNSYTDQININADFTAQSTADAAYVLAVIHFFRSVTKMFYGSQDTSRGSPPPLVFLSGLGDYQFNNHPCLVSAFNYVLPPDVDYISSGSPNNTGLNLQPLQNLYSSTLNAVSPTVTRLANAFLPPGAQNALPAPLQSLLNNPTYVPSKINIQISLLPVQTRQQVSQVFNLKDFASGDLLKKGFW